MTSNSVFAFLNAFYLQLGTCWLLHRSSRFRFVLVIPIVQYLNRCTYYNICNLCILYKFIARFYSTVFIVIYLHNIVIIIIIIIVICSIYCICIGLYTCTIQNIILHYWTCCKLLNFIRNLLLTSFSILYIKHYLSFVIIELRLNIH